MACVGDAFDDAVCSEPDIIQRDLSPREPQDAEEPDVGA